MSTAIEVNNLSKVYQLGQFNTGTLGTDLQRWWAMKRGKEDPFLKIGEKNDRSKKGESDFVWSLKDIDFKIDEGDAVGIIGKNGAGKSTLLKILSQITGPTTGSVKIKGRVASLLEVGTGFHPELSGRDNIFLNGAILGMRKKEIARKFDEIVDFSGVERYIDTPVKRYSSGMYVRLAFAVAAHLESEILIVDEVLAVGDAEFQKKSISKLDNINTAHEKTVLFVSHNILLIENLCRKAIFLENGEMKNFGDVNDVIANYAEKTAITNSTWKGRIEDESMVILGTSINEGAIGTEIKTSEPLEIKIKVEIKTRVEAADFSFIINSSFNYPILTGVFNDFNDIVRIEKGVYEVIFVIPPYTLATGTYNLDFRIGYPYIKQIDTSQCHLSFQLKSESGIGNRYFAENAKLFNSIVRSTYFKSMNKVG